MPPNETPDNIERLATTKAIASGEKAVVVLWLGWGTTRYFYAVIGKVDKHLSLWDGERSVAFMHDHGRQPVVGSKTFLARQSAIADARDLALISKRERMTPMKGDDLNEYEHMVAFVRTSHLAIWWPALVLRRINIPKTLRAQVLRPGSPSSDLPVLLLKWGCCGRPAYAWIRKHPDFFCTWGVRLPNIAHEDTNMAFWNRPRISPQLMRAAEAATTEAKTLLQIIRGKRFHHCCCKTPPVSCTLERCPTKCPAVASKVAQWRWHHKLAVGFNRIVLARTSVKRAWWPALTVDPFRVSKELRAACGNKCSDVLVYWYAGNSSGAHVSASETGAHHEFSRVRLSEDTLRPFVPVPPLSGGAANIAGTGTDNAKNRPSPTSSSSKTSSSSETARSDTGSVTGSEAKLRTSLRLQRALLRASADAKLPIRGAWLFLQRTAMATTQVDIAKRIIVWDKPDGTHQLSSTKNRNAAHRSGTVAEIVQVDTAADSRGVRRVTLRVENSNRFETRINLAELDFEFISRNWTLKKYRHEKQMALEDNKGEGGGGGGGGGYGQVSKDTEYGKDAVANFVQCDTCSRWFSLPPGSAAWDCNQSFVCSLFTNKPTCEQFLVVRCCSCGCKIEGTSPISSICSSCCTLHESASRRLPPRTPTDPAIFAVCLFCGIGLSTWSFRLSGIQPCIVVDADREALHNHWLNFGDVKHGELPLEIVRSTTLDDILKYCQRQPPLACIHIVARLGTTRDKTTFGRLTREVLKQIVENKASRIEAHLRRHVVVIGVATPPCFDISLSNFERDVDRGLRSMTTAYAHLKHLYTTGSIATYVLEMVARGVKKHLARWAMKGARKGQVTWDYLWASNWLCPSERERFIMKPRRQGFWPTPKPLSDGEFMTIGEAIGFSHAKDLGLLGTTWTPEDHLYRAMDDICFTITGNIALLCQIRGGRVSKELRRLTPIEQIALMGFPPTITSAMQWTPSSTKSKKAHWIGAGWCLHMGLAIATSVKLGLNAAEVNHLAMVVRAVNADFRGAKKRGRRPKKKVHERIKRDE